MNLIKTTCRDRHGIDPTFRPWDSVATVFVSAKISEGGRGAEIAPFLAVVLLMASSPSLYCGRIL